MSAAPVPPGAPVPEAVAEIWVYLATSPLLHLWLTLAAYQGAQWLSGRLGGHPLLNPVLVAVLILVAVLTATGTDYATYFDGAQFVHFLLGPATVALAVSLYRQIERVRRAALPLAAAILAGSLTAAGTAVGLAWAMGAAEPTVIALAPKSVTAPVAMGIAEALGGLPSLTAVLVILTGVLGAMFGPPLLTALGVRDPAATGVALGTASHGIGTARALEIRELAGAFSALAMGLNALATAILLPILWRLLA